MTKINMTDLNSILDEYGVELWGVITNGDTGETKLVLDHNIYYKSQEEMENKIRELGNVTDINYRQVA